MNQETDLVYLFKNTEKMFKCVRCRGSLSPPFSHCTSGHLVCSQCRGSTCPTRKCKGSLVSSAVLDGLFELLPKPCEYSDRGCGDVSVNGRHEQVCEFRTIRCTVGADNSCSWSGTIRDWKKHVHLVHSQYMLIHARDSNHVKKALLPYTFKQKWESECTYHVAGKKVFLFLMELKNGKICFVGQYIPIFDDKFSYCMRVNCYTSDKSSMKTGKDDFNFSISVKVLKIGLSDSLKSKSEFYGVLSKDFTRNPTTHIEFEVLKSKFSSQQYISP